MDGIGGMGIIGSLIFSGTVMVVLALYSLRYRSYPPAIPYSILMFAAAYWAFNYAMELSTSTLSLKIILQEIRHIVVPFIGVIELWLVIAFIGREQWLRKRYLLPFLIIPLGIAILALTSQYHTLFRYNYSVDLTGPVPFLLFQDGPGYMINLLYTYLLMITAWILLILGERESHKFYHYQKWLVFCALITPVIGSVIFEFGLSSLHGFNPAPSLFWVSGIIYAIAFFRYGFLDLIPVGRSRVIDNLNIAIIILDSELRIVDVNPAAEKLFNTSSSKAIGKHLDMITPEWTDLLTFVDNQSPDMRDLYLKTSYGEQIFEGIHSSLRSKSGEIEGWIITLIDKTYQKRLERELKKSEKKYHLLFENVPIGIGIATPSGMILEANRAAEMITGYNHGELTSLNLVTMYVHPGEREQLVSLAQEQRQVVDYELPLKRSDGSLYSGLLNIVHSNLDEQEVNFITLRDVTEQKNAEESLHESNQKLRLLTGLTRHDIINQVNVVQLLHELALESSDLTEIYEYLSKAQEAGDQIEKTIGFTREYEDFGIVSSGWQPVHQIIESAKTEVLLGDVILDNQIPDELLVYADPIIRKVFTTLMENAIRHGERITSIQICGNICKNDLIITCIDDGVGIQSDEKMRIFENGYGKHTGIGLFLAREILSITGLSIRETGVHGEGATFEIFVPEQKYRMNQGEIK